MAPKKELIDNWGCGYVHKKGRFIAIRVIVNKMQDTRVRLE